MIHAIEDIDGDPKLREAAAAIAEVSNYKTLTPVEILEKLGWENNAATLFLITKALEELQEG